MRGGIVTILLDAASGVITAQIVVEDELFDALLLSLLCFALISVCYCERGI